ncbi:MAG: hypothetical protein PWP67_903 [Clostridium butyricum]|nr:hypothetical protein [Clostridium butyricum]MDN5317831.1 hypothetical protein [Thermoanaerobacterium sp.]
MYNHNKYHNFNDDRKGNLQYIDLVTIEKGFIDIFNYKIMQEFCEAVITKI